jgi:hypothetical protein
VLASLLTALVLIAFDAVAAPTTTTRTQPNLQSIASHQTLLQQEIDRQEERSRRMDARLKTVLSMTTSIYRRQGSDTVTYGEPYFLLGQIYCEVKNFPSCAPSASPQP